MSGTLHVFAHNVWTTILSSVTPNHVKPWKTTKIGTSQCDPHTSFEFTNHSLVLNKACMFGSGLFQFLKTCFQTQLPMWHLTKVPISYLFNIQVPTIMNKIKATSNSEDDNKTNLESKAAKVEYFCKESVKLLTNCNSNESFISKTLRPRHS